MLPKRQRRTTIPNTPRAKVLSNLSERGALAEGELEEPLEEEVSGASLQVAPELLADVLDKTNVRRSK